MRRLLVGYVVLLVLSLGSAQITETVGPWSWEFGPTSSFGILYDAYSANGSPNDFADGWFFFYVDSTNLPFGGVTRDDKLVANSVPEYLLFKRTGNNIGSLTIDATLRLEDNGFATALWELTNTGAPQTFVLSNKRDNTGAFTSVYQTSNGDLLVSVADSWIILNGGSSGVNIVSFGEANLLDSFTLGVGSGDQVDWEKSVTINTGETQSILAVLGIDDEANLAATAMHARNILDSATDFYTYLTPSGRRMLAHLTAAQLLNVVNWDFVAAGVGGDPHGINFDGSSFELPSFAETYCLFHDRSLQVNIRVDGSYGMIKGVVVFARHHGIILYADVSSNGVPQYFVDDRLLSVPTVEGENRLISTRVAPFHFSSNPLKQLERYHENGLFLRQLVSIVGGYHPVTGGFFNVAVHKRPVGDAEFSSILQLPTHPLGDLGFKAAAISNIWHDLAQ